MRRWMLVGLLVGSLCGSSHSAAKPQTGVTATVEVPINGMTVVAQAVITIATTTNLQIVAEVPPDMQGGALVLTHADGQSTTVAVTPQGMDGVMHYQSQRVAVVPGDTFSWQLSLDRAAVSGERVTITGYSDSGGIAASATVLLNQITTTWLPLIIGADQ